MPAQHKKIAFFGTPAFTTDFLDALHAAGYSPSLVVTNPDRPAGRGMTLVVPEPKTWAIKHAVAFLQPEKIDESFIKDLSKEPWDLFIVVAYGSILPDALIKLPIYGTINVHYSLLPTYRGATPVESAILHGDTKTGVVIQQMRFKLDTGPVISKKEVVINPYDTTLSLREKLNVEAIKMLPETIETIFDKRTNPEEQDEDNASYCKKILKEDGEIGLSDDAVILDRKFRAYQPWPGLFFFTTRGGRNIRVKIKSAHLEDEHFVVDTVIPESSKPMPWAQFKDWHSF